MERWMGSMLMFAAEVSSRAGLQLGERWAVERRSYAEDEAA